MPQWSRPPTSQTNWFAIATAIAALAVVFCGGGLGGSEPIVGQTEPLTLTLSAPQICETTPASGASASRLRQNAEGEWTERYDVFLGWFRVAEVDVAWTVSGGAGPYQLTIDGEKRDPAHEYVGATGTASVSCAMTSGAETFIDISERGYKEQPEVDSGVKTIVATVTDATGATAEASVDVYVILAVQGSGSFMAGGKTYRVHGHLLTVPEGIDVEIDGYIASDGGGGVIFELDVVNHDAEVFVEIFPSELRPAGRDIRVTDTDTALDLHAKIDELVQSIGRLLTTPTPQR